MLELLKNSINKREMRVNQKQLLLQVLQVVKTVAAHEIVDMQVKLQISREVRGKNQSVTGLVVVQIEQ